MAFKKKYEIKADYLTKGSRKRPGNIINVDFLVAHDTGNPGSTAQGNVTYYKRVQESDPASAHLFVDDKEIIECVPALTAKPERAYHVIYNVTTDNKLFGDDANDTAIGVELCFGKQINNEEAYKRYVWVLAYLCYQFKLDPEKDIVGHKILDPGRKIDPHNSLKLMGKTYEGLLKDVAAEFKECSAEVPTPAAKPSAVKPSVTKKEVKPKVQAVSKPTRPYPGKPLKIGSRGRDVEAAQRGLGFKGHAVDGIFGRNTSNIVKQYQERKGLKVDGIIGKATWDVMF
ncbi:peptidoglycan recognition protein family protein [Peribacillus frigoritolerans]|uniref:N-acetylmuramoyl-L-alanine amidase n=1 Tax=Peribacillus castrilensis TaxID=2897690 RepID=A0AAW9NG16_9BACI|nr:N-acetylmuramoyl-L-alanine amidase [Peribacillus castrilensis]